MLEIYLGLIFTLLFSATALIVINGISMKSHVKVVVIIEDGEDEKAVFAAKIIRERFFPNADIFLKKENGETEKI